MGYTVDGQGLRVKSNEAEDKTKCSEITRGIQADESRPVQELIRSVVVAFSNPRHTDQYKEYFCKSIHLFLIFISI